MILVPDTDPITARDHSELAQLRAQLRCLQQEHDRSTRMAAEVLAAVGEDFRLARRKHGNAEDHAGDTLTLEDGKALLPLSVKEQRISLPRLDTPHVLFGTVLCANSSDVATVQIRSLLGLENSPRGPATGTRTSDGANLLQMVAGEPKHLLTLPAQAEHGDFLVNRVGGNLCLLRLELRPVHAGTHTDAAACAQTAEKSPDAARKGALWRAQLLLREGRAERAITVATAHASEVERAALHLLHATVAAHDEAAWLAQVNHYVHGFGIAPIELAPTGPSRFLRFKARVTQAVLTGPLVSILMPAFNAERTLEFAAASILAQSWRPLELILIDDCSTDGTWQAMQRVAAADSRVKLRRNTTNVGPYVSKNLALALVTGEYITCHDADDWAHPQRIERQLEALLRHPHRSSACVAGHVRVTDSGHFDGFTRVGETSHDGALRLAHVSCMVPTDFMRRYLGHWDCVRFAADGEILERLGRLLGPDLLKLRQLSMFSLDAPSTLSHESLHGISKVLGSSRVRLLYRDQWRKWHASMTLDNARLAFPPVARRFEAPLECLVPDHSITSVLAPVTTRAATDQSISV